MENDVIESTPDVHRRVKTIIDKSWFELHPNETGAEEPPVSGGDG